MRFIFQLLIGMVFFNAMLIALAPFFPTQEGGSTYSPIDWSGVDPSSKLGENISSFQSLDIMGWLSQHLTIFVTTFFLAVFVGVITGGSVPIGQLLGASLVISLFITLWAGLTTPLVGIAGSYPTIMSFYNIFSIVLGVVVMISVVEIFTGKGDESA